MASLSNERCCDNCKHLIEWNGNNKYAECDKTTMMFYPFEVDTRETVCNFWEKKND